MFQKSEATSRETDYARTIDEALIYLGASDAGNHDLAREFPTCLAFNHHSVTEIKERRRTLGLPIHVAPEEIGSGWDVGMLFSGERTGDQFQAVRSRSLPFRSLRKLQVLGIVSKSAVIVCEARNAAIGRRGDCTFGIRSYYMLPDGNWVQINPNVASGREYTRFTATEWRTYKEYAVEEVFQAASGALVHWVTPLVWRTRFSLPGSPHLDFVTDPIGIGSIFTMRDKPEGRTRREALRHWVSEHWRMNRHDPEEEIKVRAHLRGQEHFTWFGLNCEILPSQTDMDKVARLIEERKNDMEARRPRKLAIR